MTPLAWWEHKSIFTPFYSNYSLIRVGANGTSRPSYLYFSLLLPVIYYFAAHRPSSLALDSVISPSKGKFSNKICYILIISSNNPLNVHIGRKRHSSSRKDDTEKRNQKREKRGKTKEKEKEEKAEEEDNEEEEEDRVEPVKTKRKVREQIIKHPDESEDETGGSEPVEKRRREGRKPSTKEKAEGKAKQSRKDEEEPVRRSPRISKSARNRTMKASALHARNSGSDDEKSLIEKDFESETEMDALEQASDSLTNNDGRRKRRRVAEPEASRDEGTEKTKFRV
jgi:hypothetical protein